MATMRVEDYEGPSDAPCAVVIVEGIGGEDVVQVVRTVAGKDQTVRGGSALSILDSGSLVDYDVPVGVDVTYTVITSADRLTGSYRVDSPYGWITDPYDPSVAVPFATRQTPECAIVLGFGALKSAARSASVTTTQILGDAYPVAVGSTRAAPSAIPFVIAALTDDAAESVATLVNSGGVLIIRPLPGMPALDPVSFVSIPDATPRYVGAPYGDPTIVIEATGSLVRPMRHAVVWEAWTYDAAIAAAVNGTGTSLTYAQVATLAQLSGWTWADYARDPTIEGAL